MRKSHACGSWFTNSSRVLPRSRVVYQPLRWPNTVLARALADAIQRAHKDCKNKHAVDTAIILFAQCPLYLCYFSS